MEVFKMKKAKKKVMKKAAKKLIMKNSALVPRKKVMATKKKKTKKIMVAKSTESQVHNTAGAKMPNPEAHNRPLRKDVRFAFR
jgi:hypothetical protein